LIHYSSLILLNHEEHEPNETEYKKSAFYEAANIDHAL